MSSPLILCRLRKTSLCGLVLLVFVQSCESQNEAPEVDGGSTDQSDTPVVDAFTDPRPEDESSPDLREDCAADETDTVSPPACSFPMAVRGGTCVEAQSREYWLRAMASRPASYVSSLGFDWVNRPSTTRYYVEERQDAPAHLALYLQEADCCRDYTGDGVSDDMFGFYVAARDRGGRESESQYRLNTLISEMAWVGLLVWLELPAQEGPVQAALVTADYSAPTGSEDAHRSAVEGSGRFQPQGSSFDAYGPYHVSDDGYTDGTAVRLHFANLTIPYFDPDFPEPFAIELSDVTLSMTFARSALRGADVEDPVGTPPDEYGEVSGLVSIDALLAEFARRIEACGCSGVESSPFFWAHYPGCELSTVRIYCSSEVSRQVCASELEPSVCNACATQSHPLPGFLELLIADVDHLDCARNDLCDAEVHNPSCDPCQGSIDAAVPPFLSGLPYCKCSAGYDGCADHISVAMRFSLAPAVLRTVDDDGT